MGLEYMKNIKGEITMTFNEKLFIDHPEYINDTKYYVHGCPSDYGYEEPRDLFRHCEYQMNCEECWERETK